MRFTFIFVCKTQIPINVINNDKSNRSIHHNYQYIVENVAVKVDQINNFIISTFTFQWFSIYIDSERETLA